VKKFGDVVEFVRNGVPVKALVVQSNIQKDGENLTVAYLDPAMASNSMAGILVDKAIAKAFVTPLTEGKSYGWRDLPEAAEAPKTSGDEFSDKIMPHLIELSKTVSEIDPTMEVSPDGTLISAKALLENYIAAKQVLAAYDAKVDALEKELAAEKDKPTVADMDAHAAEEQVKEATSAPEQLDEVQGEVQPGDPESPHAI
jgi:hypothetical protein